MTQFANIDKKEFFTIVETSDWYQLESVDNNTALDDKRREEPDVWLKQDTAWLVDEIPNISFLDIWDTLLEDKKTLHNRRWAHFVVWKASKSVELQYDNKFMLRFEPDYMTDVENLVKWDIDTPYVTRLKDSTDTEYQSLYATYWPLACIIEEDWRYEILHKEEIRPQPDTDTVCCYVDIYRKDTNWIYQILIKWWVAVSWWKWSFEKTFSGSTSWTEPNGSCSVKVSFKLGDVLQRIPTWWYIERDLLKWDVLVLRVRDKEPDIAWTWEPVWNELTLEPYSNIFSVKHVGYGYLPVEEIEEEEE